MTNTFTAQVPNLFAKKKYNKNSPPKSDDFVAPFSRNMTIDLSEACLSYNANPVDENILGIQLLPFKVGLKKIWLQRSTLSNISCERPVLAVMPTEWRSHFYCTA